MTYVQHELIGNNLPSNSLNEIEKEEVNISKSSKSSSESSEEIFEKGDKKNERSINIEQELAAKLNKIPRLVAGKSLFTN